MDAAPTSSASHGRTALSVPGFRRYYFGFWFATSGYWVLKIAIGWSAWELSHSPWLTGLVAALALLPTVVLSPIFGVYADRIRLKVGIPVVISGQVAVGLALTAMEWAGVLTISGLVALAAAWGMFAAAYQPMRLSMMGRLVDRELFASALGMTSVAFNTARWGRMTRAATQDREMLAALGINVPLIYTGIFVLGSALAGIGGALAAPFSSPTPGMDATIIVDCFVIVIIGGLGSLWGTFLGALIYGLVFNFGSVIVPNWQDVFAYLLLMVVLLVRPWGLFGQPETGG
jgi:branched-subunit amino acid ABC-type transport system permease component